ncbi:TPA: DUF1819 family protein [Candidatus Scatousia excrementigallinarum]|uniref:DUF1819 family protein n=1 Tax=Candidatus Scatousia excrementigallinarum TaxID=2840935 RepID=A0A9D1EWZ6_9BACT|nr:DUF1819 family protein [Candidatus Scatousia excrementigallinarum]
MAESKEQLKANSKYSGSGALTREQFLFHEMRVTAKLMSSGLDDKQIAEAIIRDNLFQYPTEKSLRNILGGCIRRLKALNDETLVAAVASQPTEVAKQICLYAMMKNSSLVYDFMVDVIGEKYRFRDLSFGKTDVNAFFFRIQEQDDYVATWSDSTINKIKQVLIKTLVETEYLDNIKSNKINPVWIDSILLNSIKANGDYTALPAFNYFE